MVPDPGRPLSAMREGDNNPTVHVIVNHSDATEIYKK